MLSNTAERKPSPRVLCHDDAGRRSTGIIEASATSATRNTAPEAAPGTTFQSGRRHADVTMIEIHRPRPSHGPLRKTSGIQVLPATFVAMIVTRRTRTITALAQSIGETPAAAGRIEQMRFCWC